LRVDGEHVKTTAFQITVPADDHKASLQQRGICCDSVLKRSLKRQGAGGEARQLVFYNRPHADLMHTCSPP